MAFMKQLFAQVLARVCVGGCLLRGSFTMPGTQANTSLEVKKNARKENNQHSMARAENILHDSSRYFITVYRNLFHNNM
jgi:cyclophilin family peptidyl-prolyl cis-trans isomerase